MRRSLVIFSILLVASVCFSIQLIAPQAIEVKNGDLVDLGTIGPGQTVSLQMSPQVSSGGLYGTGGIYDIAYAQDLPAGWTSSQSKLYGNPLQVTIKSPADAREGDYLANVTMMDEYNGEHLGNVTFRVRLHLTYDVMSATVTPAEQIAGPGQPALYEIAINNKGSTGDVFEVTAIGPKRWSFRKLVFVPASSQKVIHYEIVGDEPGKYVNTIRVVSTSSDLIRNEQNVVLKVRSDVFGDYLATNRGTLIFPIFQAPAYGLAGLISNLWK